jgi:hypothetical protein
LDISEGSIGVSRDTNRDKFYPIWSGLQMEPGA